MSTSPSSGKVWIHNAAFDSIFILMPPFMALFVVWLLPVEFRQTDNMPLIGWCILILFVDVAHVYSTLYNTYFDKSRFERRKKLFLLVPFFCYLVGLGLHMLGAMVFWRALAYIAVFHFVRQQYGFMRLYARKTLSPRWGAIIDTIVIYAATLYPLIYWHCTPSRNFNWFVANDFLIADATTIKLVAGIVYIFIVMCYLMKEVVLFVLYRSTNLPKNMVICGTLISWYFGIVYFNGDMAFTLLNVVSHGIPYMALIWAGLGKKATVFPDARQRSIARYKYGIIIFLCSLFVLAYLEEGLWDGFVWQEHRSVFVFFMHLPHVTNDFILALLVPLLSLPQSTHYVLDGFIWRKKYA